MKVESPRTLADSVMESPAADSAVKIAMVFRLWASASREAKDNQAANALGPRPGVLALIEDAAAAKLGVFVATGDHMAVSGLKELADALVLSRQIQHGMRGFRRQSGAAAVALSIAIDFSGRPAPAVAKKLDGDENLQKSVRLSPEVMNGTQEISHDLFSLLAKTKPAQVLITHDLLQQITAIKGLPLRSFPGRFGVYEYLWTGEDELEMLQSEPQLTLAALPSTVPVEAVTKELKDAPTGAIVAGPVEDEPPREAKKAHQLQTMLPLGPALWVGIFAAAVLVAIALVGFSFFHAHSSTPTNTASPALTTTLPPVTRNSQSQAPKGVKNRGQKAAASVPAPAPVAAEAPAAGQPTSSQPCTLPGEINKYADLAESDRERGDYANAIRIFRQVLNCDPNNAEAREGLNRAIQAQEQSR
jgi:hypothetical protein